MTKGEMVIAWLVIVAIFGVVATAPKCKFYDGGARLRADKGSESLALFVNWSIVLQRVILIVLVGIALILPGRRVRK